MESWFAVSDKGHGCFCDFERSRNEAIEKERADQNRKYIRICGERDLSSSLFDCISKGYALYIPLVLIFRGTEIWNNSISKPTDFVPNDFTSIKRVILSFHLIVRKSNLALVELIERSFER